jgi:hypothetical protein
MVDLTSGRHLLGVLIAPGAGLLLAASTLSLGSGALAQVCPSNMPVCIGIDGGACQYSDFNLAYAAAASDLYIAGANAGGARVIIDVTMPDGLPVYGTINNPLGINVLGAARNDCTREAGPSDPQPILRGNGGRVLNIFADPLAVGLLDLRLAHLDIVNGEALGKSGGNVEIDIWINLSSPITFEDVYIADGHTNQHGGCVYANQAGVLRFEDSTLEDCVAESPTSDGGAIYAVGPNYGLTLHNTIVRNSTASDKGGCVNVDNLQVDLTGTTVLENCTARIGGAIWAGGSAVTAPSTLELADEVAIRYNHATVAGGGLYIDGDEEPLPPQPVLTTSGDVRITGNRTDGDGGGVYLVAADVDLVDATLEGNIALGDGGGVFATGAADGVFPTRLDLRGTTSISSSDATRGGGIFAEETILFTVESTAIRFNSAVDGAGIYLNQTVPFGGGEGGVFYDRTEIAFNDASGNGGGLHVRGQIELDRKGNIVNDALSASVSGETVIAGNSAANGGGIYLSGAELSLWERARVSDNTATSNGGGIAAIAGTLAALVDRVPTVVATRAAEIYAFGDPYRHQAPIRGTEPDPLGGVRIERNTADAGGAGGAGAGIYADHSQIGPEFYYVVLANNEALPGTGGGVALRNDAQMTASNVVFHGNSAATGGGLHAQGSHATVQSEFGGQDAPCNPLADFATTPDRYCAEFHANHGGAIHGDGSLIEVQGVSFRFNDGRANAAADPPAAAIYLENQASLSAQSCLFAENDDEFATVRVDDATFHSRFNTYAEANSLAILYNATADGSFRGNVVWDPMVSPGAKLFLLDAGPIPGACNIGDGIDNADFSGKPNNLTLDPIFTVDKSRGSQFHLQLLSPAVDQCVLAVSHDLDGVLRSQQNVDMGAFEGAFP